jgi:alcohol dehydrogenase
MRSYSDAIESARLLRSATVHCAVTRCVPQQRSVCARSVQLPPDAFANGYGDYRIVRTLCPGGKERMRRMIELIRRGRVDFAKLVTHGVPLERIDEAYALCRERNGNVIKIAVKP